MTGPADRPQQPEPAEPTGTDGASEPFSGQANPSGTRTATPAWACGSPGPVPLTAKAETLLDDVGSQPESPLAERANSWYAPRLRKPGPAVRSAHLHHWISLPPSDSGIRWLHVRMKDPEPEPEAGL